MWLIEFHIITVPLGLIVAWSLNSSDLNWTIIDLSRDNVVPFPKPYCEQDRSSLAA